MIKKLFILSFLFCLVGCAEKPDVFVGSAGPARVIENGAKDPDDPVLYQSTGGVYMAPRAPTSNEPLVINNLAPSYEWIDTTNWDFYRNQNPDRTAATWIKMISVLNIADNLPSNLLTTDDLVENLPVNLQDTQVGISRSYSDLNSPAFNTAYQPSTVRDSFIAARFSLTSTLLTAADITAEVDSGSGYAAVGECSLSGLAASSKCVISIIVPKSSSYRFIQVSGTGAIISVKRLDL